MRVELVVYWDIDGTLLTTGRAGVPALEDGAEHALGVRPNLGQMATAGLTDPMIARRILSDLGHAPDEDLERELLRRYVERLPARLLEKRGGVLPGASEALDALSARADVANVLLTGNMRAGAMAKLASYRLDHYFEFGGFGEDGFTRTEIAKAAVARARARFGKVAEAGILIGDTPYDCRAGAEVGLRVVAVASTPAQRSDLESCSPWWLVDQVPPADELVRMAGVRAELS